MRSVCNFHLKLGSVLIEGIKIDLLSHDDIPATPKGMILQRRVRRQQGLMRKLRPKAA